MVVPVSSNKTIPSDRDFLDFASKCLKKSDSSDGVVRDYYGMKVIKRPKRLSENNKIVIMGDKQLIFDDLEKKTEFVEKMRDALIRELSIKTGIRKAKTLDDWLKEGSNEEKLGRAISKDYYKIDRTLTNDILLQADSLIDKLIIKERWSWHFTLYKSKISENISTLREIRKIIGNLVEDRGIKVSFSSGSGHEILLNSNSYFKFFHGDQTSLVNGIQSAITNQDYGEARALIKRIIKKERRRLNFSFKEGSINRHMQNIYQLENIDKQCENIEASRSVISQLDTEQLYRSYEEYSPQNIEHRHRINAIEVLANDPSHQPRSLEFQSKGQLKENFEFLTYKLLSESEGINLRKNKLDLETMLGKLESKALSNELYQPVIENIVKYSENTAFVKKAFKLLDKGNKVAVLAEASEENRGIIYRTLRRKERDLLQPQVDEKIKAISSSDRTIRPSIKRG